MLLQLQLQLLPSAKGLCYPRQMQIRGSVVFVAGILNIDDMGCFLRDFGSRATSNTSRRLQCISQARAFSVLCALRNKLNVAVSRSGALLSDPFGHCDSSRRTSK